MRYPPFSDRTTRLVPDSGRLAYLHHDSPAMELTYDHTELPVLAGPLVDWLLAEPEPFCLWLHGELGAGKTTLAAKLLQCLGVPSVVDSPTYTLAHLYELPPRSAPIAHVDLYRWQPRATSHSSAAALDDLLSQLGLDALGPLGGCLVEWPMRLLELPRPQGVGPKVSYAALGDLEPTHHVVLDQPPGLGSTTRRLSLFRHETFDFTPSSPA